MQLGSEQHAGESGRTGSLVVVLQHELVQGLALLSVALDDPVTDLEAVLSVLSDDLTAAVPSYLGLTVTLHVDDNALVLSTLEADDPVEVRASLLLPLLPLGATTTPGSVGFYGSAAGAFIDLADDARWIFQLDGQSLLDGYLPSTAELADRPGIRGLAGLIDINQAVGVLIEDGHTPPEAETALRKRAADTSESLRETARHVLRTLDLPAATEH